MLNKSILSKIKKHAVMMDWNVAFKGKSKGNRHLFRVAKNARHLAKKEKANIFICEAGAWLHDIGLIAGNDNEPNKIRKIAEEFLKTLPITQEDQKKIANCVESHEGLAEPKTLEARIVHDADALDKQGPLGIVRHTWKIANLIDQDAKPNQIILMLKKHIRWRRFKLFTSTARKSPLLFETELENFFSDKEKATLIIKGIMQLAKQGLTTEQIASILLKSERNSFTKVLENQIKGKY